MTLRVFQSLWATEERLPGRPERPAAARIAEVAAAGYDGLGLDLGAMPIEEAETLAPLLARHGLRGLVTAFPRSVEELRPALRLAHDIGAPFVIVVGQVMPVTVAEMVPVIRAWLAISAEEGMPIQFETHRNCITNDLFATLQLIEAIPGMRLSADLSHYVVDRELSLPPTGETTDWMSRILARSDSFQGRVATRSQVQVPLGFPQNARWVAQFRAWWREGFAGFRARGGTEGVFLCELGPPDYAITGADGHELSDRRAEALLLRDMARAEWDAAAP